MNNVAGITKTKFESEAVMKNVLGAKVGLRGAEAAFRNFETASLQSETSGCFVAMLAKVVQVR